MASGFYNIPVHPDSIEYTSFVTPECQMEFLKMPFGLRNCPSVFTKAVMNALGSLAHDYVLVFMDDLCVKSATIPEALDRLDHVLNVLTSAGFSLNPSKCEFVVRKVQYLGYDVCDGEIRPNTKKIDALISLPPPSTVSSLRRFLGLASYFRQFIPHFSVIAAPLYRLLGSKTNLIWLPEHEDSRKKLITHLTTEPVLTIFNPQLPVELHCDACSLGYAGILLHIVDKKPRAIAFYSQRTTPTESRYHSYELETMAVVKSIYHFRVLLQNISFTVATDCQSLKETYLKQILNPRIHRWWSFLQSFDFKIIYRPANQLQHADYLSRHPISTEVSQVAIAELIGSEVDDSVDLGDTESVSEIVDTNQPSCSLSIHNTDLISTHLKGVSQHPTSSIRHDKIVNLATLSDDWILLGQQQDSEITELLDKVKNKQFSEDILKTYEIRSGVLCRNIQRGYRVRCVPIVPHAYKYAIVHNVHDSLMHLGYEKTLEKVSDYYWFRNMAKFVRKYTDNCLTCKVTKTPSGKKPIALHPIPKVSIPWHTVHIDISGKLSGKNDSKEYCIVIIDAFTKFVLLCHTFKLDSTSAVDSLRSAISLFGPPTRVIADRGRCFASKDFQIFCNRFQIDLHLIATGSARANGQCERIMSVLQNMLTATELGDRTWQDALQDIQLAMNSTMNRITRSSPLEMMLGKVSKPLGMITPREEFLDNAEVDLDHVRDIAAQNITKAASYDKSRFDKTKAKVKLLSPGDLVLLQNEPRNQTKLHPKFRGVFKIQEVLDGDRYLVKSLTGNRVYKYAHDRVRKVPDSDLFPELNASDSESEREGSTSPERE
uniref:RNA-directed DNA polymerase n=1 Tax=Lygus hesperus TaxID=30085 RepID=A0A0A9XJ85_LYGHE